MKFKVKKKLGFQFKNDLTFYCGPIMCPEFPVFSNWLNKIW